MKRLRNVPWVSGMLVVINVIVFLMCTFSGNVLYNKGELDVVSVLAGKQYGRLLWAMFLHGIEHIFNNMVLLFFLGAMIEKVTGHVTFLVLYFLSGIGGNLCSLFGKASADGLFGICRCRRSHLWTGRSTACLDFLRIGNLCRM